jgi:hypothetical protein
MIVWDDYYYGWVKIDYMDMIINKIISFINRRVTSFLYVN